MCHVFLEEAIICKSRPRIRLVAGGILEMGCQSEHGIPTLASAICLRDFRWQGWVVKELSACYKMLELQFFNYLIYL